MSGIRTLSDCPLISARCVECNRELPAKSAALGYRTHGGAWVIVHCSSCDRWSPFRLEATCNRPN